MVQTALGDASSNLPGQGLRQPANQTVRPRPAGKRNRLEPTRPIQLHLTDELMGYALREAAGDVPAPCRTAGIGLLLLVCLGGARFVSAQSPTGALQGTVTASSPRGRPSALQGVTLTLSGRTSGLPPQTTYSGAGGAYEFRDVPAGSYTLRVTSRGLKRVTRNIQIPSGRTVVRNIRMHLQVVRQSVKVEAKASVVSVQSAAPPIQTLHPQQLQTLPVARRELRQELPVTPGVVPGRSGKIFIKGVPEGQGMLLLDSAQAVEPVTGSYSINVPVNAIQSLDVYKAPFGAQYGGFTGGLANIGLKPPPARWGLTLGRMDPSFRGKEGHLAGLSRATPQVRFGGPLWKNKVNFAESFRYELDKPDVRGLAWPENEKKLQGYDSITQFQLFLSPRNYASFTLSLFPRREEWADLNALVPRPSTVDWGQKGFSLEGRDIHQFGSGATLETFFDFMKADTYSHGHGPQPMLLTPTGVAGNAFNSWGRTSRQEQAEAIFNFPARQWVVRNEIQIGAGVVHRGFTGFSRSHPVQILRNDGSPAEQIDFSGSGNLAAADTAVTFFGQDHWVFNPRLAVTAGLRLFHQTDGDAVDFAPRLGWVYAFDPSGRTVLRAGIGMFYDRTPLLAAGFDQNPTRIVTPFGPDGSPPGPSVAYLNACVRASGGSLKTLPGCSDLGSTPYNLTWRVELSRRLTDRLSTTVSGLYSHTFRLFVINPVLTPEGGGLLRLSNTGSSFYREFQWTLKYAIGEKASMSLSYVRSSSRGSLNTTDGIFTPFEAPVIRPDAYASLPSDVPNRVTGFGLFKLPWKLDLSPSVVLSSGLPYSDIDALHNYAGVPDSQRYPVYFALNWRIYRTFHLPFRYLRRHAFSLGFYSINTTGRRNPTAVYDNITSPFFGQFTGFEKRINGIVIDTAD